MSNLATIDLDDVATPAALAAELGVPRNLVGMWVVRREANGFPEPVVTIPGRAGARDVKLYSRRAVRAWLET